MNDSNSEPLKASILVVDDTYDNLRLLVGMLSQQGYLVRPAPNGSLALAAAQADPPDLILLDIKMPDKDGYQVCQELKANQQTCEIPVIFLSALDEVFDKVKAFTVGGVDYITKPFQFEEVLARIENQLTIRKLQMQLKAQNAQLQQEIQERQKIEEALRAEQEKSERLLLNILPSAIAQQLKQNQGALAERFDEATVLFADLVSFTPLAAHVSPLELVSFLNQIFSEFDQLAYKYGLEKIKTIGDAYMVAGGLPVPRPDHAEAIAEMALDMLSAIIRFQFQSDQPFQIRIGIHTGPVVAGVIGVAKFSYDLWGDTVNTAARMESHGIAGAIQVTAQTYERLSSQYLFEERGLIPIKGKGEMRTYLLVGRKNNDEFKLSN
jgi:adenylate cyclase